jgi:hypothetical protein
MTRLFLFFFFLGQNGLEYVAGLGDMREVDFWRDCLRRAAGCAGVAGCVSAMRKLCANLLRFIFFQGAGMGLAGAQSKLP